MAAGVAYPRTTRHLLAGDLPALRRDRLAFLEAQARERGDFVPLRFGFIRALLVSDPVAIEQVLRNSSSFVKSFAYQVMRPVAGDGLLLSEGEAWMRQRRLAQPAFQRDRLGSAAAAINALTSRMLEGWRPGQRLDVYADLMRLTAEIAGQVFFGADVGDAVDEVARQLLVVTETLTNRLDTMWVFVPDRVPTPSILRVRRAVKKLDEIIFRIIDERRRTPGERDDLFSRLLAARDEDGSRLNDRQLRDQVMTFFLAGHETTSLLLSWTLYLLAHHRDVQARLRQELSELSTDSVSVTELAGLPYLDAVLCETLRLYPPVWVMGRKVVKSCEVAGIRLQPGLSLMFSQWIIHRDPRFFDDPLRFWPERWLDGLQKRLPRYAFFPFGGGQRICIGANFAMMEAGLVLSMLLRQFGVEADPVRDAEVWPAFTLRPRSGVHLSLTRAS